jgi:hypothetical protein
MSRTYRFKKDTYMEEGILSDWYIPDPRDYCWIRFLHDPSSDEGKKRLAKFHSDNKRGFYNYVGPGWFHNMYSQRPYRRNAKKQIHRFMCEEEYEVQLLRKPKREYWT